MSVRAAARLYVRSLTLCVFHGEGEFSATSTSILPFLYSTLLPKHRPQLSLFPVHPQRSYSWPKTHQVGRTTDNWGDDRSCSKTIDSDGDRGSRELRRLTEISGGSGRARLECGITHSIDIAALLARKKIASLVCHFLLLDINQKYAAINQIKHDFLLYSQRKSNSFFSWATAVQYVLALRPPWALLIAQILFAKPASITQQHIELAEKAMTWTSYFHQLQSQWQVAKLQNLPENPVKAKQVVKAFFISRGTRGNKWRLLLFLHSK